MACSNQTAERAHPLLSELFGVRYEYRQQLPEEISQKSEPHAEPISQLPAAGFHGFTFTLSPGVF